MRSKKVLKAERSAAIPVGTMASGVVRSRKVVKSERLKFFLLGTPEDPIRDVLRSMTGKEPPNFVRGYSFDGLTDKETMDLQDWASNSVPLGWLTGIGLLEAAESQVGEAVSNGNIPGPEDWEKST